MTTHLNMTVAQSLWGVRTKPITRDLILAIVGSVFIAVAAQITVPFVPVPMTMQVFAVLAIGLAYGARLGGATLVLYVIEGLAGLPVFAGAKAGPAVILGPTGGYLIGFILATCAVGYLADKGWSRKVYLSGLAGLIGLALLYIPGLVWLGNVIGWDKPVLELGFTPFVLVDLVKVVLAALGIRALWHIAPAPK